MIAMPGRAALLIGRTYQACHTRQCITGVHDGEKKQTQLKRKRIKLGSSC